MGLEDLNLNDTSSGDLGGYFLVTITDLDLATQYPIQFQYVYADKRQNDNWSAGRYFTTTGATVPNEPQLQSTDVVGGAGFIKVTWSGNDASGNPIENFDRVDVHISGTTFGDGTKPAGSFKAAGTQTFTCAAGIYIVQLKVYSLNGASSFFSLSRTVTVTEVGEAIQTPVPPSTGGFSSRRILGGIEVSWDGTYPSAWTGFEAINIYAGTSSAATGGTYTKVGQMTANKVTNKIVVPVDGTYVRYNQPVYIHASSVNKNQVESSIVANVTSQSLGAGQATDSDINDGAVVISKLASNVLTVDNLKAGNINSTSYIRAGSGSTGARVEISSSTVGSVNPGLYIYNSGGTAVFSAPLSGGLSITGSLTATTISTSSGNFSVNSSGILSASSASVSGTITASGGSIGGITIAADGLQNSGGTFKLDSAGKARFGSSSGNAIIIDPTAAVNGYYIYHSSNGGGTASSKFSVSSSGVLTATGGNFGGTITNGSDYWNSDTSFQFGGSTGITKGATGGISIGSNVTFSGSLSAASGTFDGTLRATSGYFGSSLYGWQFDSNGYLYAPGLGSYLYPDTNPGGNANTYVLISDRGISASKGVFTGTGSALQLTNGNLEVVGTGTFTDRIYANNGITVGSNKSIAMGTGNITTGGSIASLSTVQGWTLEVTGNGSTSGSGWIIANYLGTGSGLAVHQVQSGTYAGYLRVNTSTLRHKENINYIDSNGYLNKVTDMSPAFFTYKEDYGDPSRTEIGLIAEDLEELGGFETVLHYNNEGELMGISYDKLSAMLILALKEVKSRLDALES